MRGNTKTIRDLHGGIFPHLVPATCNCFTVLFSSVGIGFAFDFTTLNWGAIYLLYNRFYTWYTTMFDARLNINCDIFSARKCHLTWGAKFSNSDDPTNCCATVSDVWSGFLVRSSWSILGYEYSREKGAAFVDQYQRGHQSKTKSNAR